MKKIFLWASLCLFAVSCSNETIESDNGVTNAEKVLAPVTVRVNGFSVTQEEMASGGTTRAAQTAASYTDVKAIDLAFYSGGTEVYKHTQLRGDNTTYTTFGEFSCNLPIGTYTMVAIARGYFDGDVFTMTSPTAAGYTSERPRETFCASQSVTVTAAGADASVTMNRIITQLNIISTDQISSGVAKIRTTYGGGSKSFDPTSGLATDDNGFSLTNNPAVQDGHLGICNFAFLATDEETMTITIEALDADNHVLFTKSVPGVPLKRNRQTTLTGAIFTTSASSAAFQVETAWIEGNTVNF
jgi:hypothetical protein